MDPRPYNYEYRKPRYSNPTFQSGNLYGSIYHFGKRIMPENRQQQNHQSSPQTQRLPPISNPKPVNSHQLKKQQKQSGYRNEEKIRYSSQNKNDVGRYERVKQELNQKNLENNIRSINNSNENKGLSTQNSQQLLRRRNSEQMRRYQSGNSLNNRRSQVLWKEEDRIYERQQKPYNIINCYPNDIGYIHRQYPKYTLESKLIENGMYGVNPQIN